MSGYQDTANRARFATESAKQGRGSKGKFGPKAATTRDTKVGTDVVKRSGTDIQKTAQRAVERRAATPGGPSRAWRVGAGIRGVAGPAAIALTATDAGYRIGKHVEKKETAKGNVKAAVDTKGGNGGYPKPVWVKGGAKKYSSAGGPPTQERSFKNKYGKTETQTYETSGERNYSDYQNDKKNKSLGLQAKTAANQDSETIENYRNYRKANNQYKGKYYGPDTFKGNMSLLKAWRKAGSPKDVKAFAKNNPNTGR
jgi:hypothetical protein